MQGYIPELYSGIPPYGYLAREVPTSLRPVTHTFPDKDTPLLWPKNILALLTGFQCVIF